MNKRGAVVAQANSALVWAILIFLVVAIVLVSGGAGALSSIGSTLSKIPGWGWVVIIFLFLLIILGKRRK